LSVAKFDVRANWWISCLISNYFSRWYTYTIGAIMGEQEAIEEDLFDAQEEIEKTATRLAGGKVVKPPTAAPTKKSSRSSRSSSSSSSLAQIEAAEVSVVASADATAVATATAMAAASNPSGRRRQLTDIKLESKDSAASYLGKYHEQAAAQSKYRHLKLLCNMTCMTHYIVCFYFYFYHFTMYLLSS
jgi:hypothetical protein